MYPYQVNQQSLIHLFNSIITARTRVQAEQPTLEPTTNKMYAHYNYLWVKTCTKTLPSIRASILVA